MQVLRKRPVYKPLNIMVEPSDIEALKALAARLHAEDPATGMSMGILVRRAIKDVLVAYARRDARGSLPPPETSQL